jgi:ABC-2 type transport system ATP-binding protein
VVSSHLLSEMELMCDRVAIIQNGKLVDVRLIKDYFNEEDQNKVAFEVDLPALALSFFNQIPAFGAVAKQSYIELSVEREQIAEAVVLMVQNGIKVYSIKPITQSLEDKFLEMTGSEQIA